MKKLIECLREPTPVSRPCRDSLLEIGQEVTPFLISRLGDPSWPYRWYLVDTLGYLEDIRAVPALVNRVLVDPNPHVRWRALWAVSACDQGSGKAAELFHENLDHQNPFRNWNAAVGLSFLRDERALPSIHAHMDDPQNSVRLEAVNALGRIWDETSSSRLRVSLFEDRDSMVRRESATILGSICDDEARKLLVEILDSDNTEIRWRAVLGLKSCRDPSYIPALQERLKTERDPDMLEHIATAIKRLEALPPGGGGRKKRFR